MHSYKRDKSKFLPILAIIILPIIAFIMHLLYMTKHIEVNHYTINSPSLPASFNNFKIAVIADLHIGLYVKERDMDINKTRGRKSRYGFNSW